MDSIRFDRLAKFTAHRRSRRAVLGALGGGLLTALGAGSVAAEFCTDPVQCGEGRTCRGGICVAQPGGVGAGLVGFCPGGEERCHGGCCYCCANERSVCDSKFSRFVLCVNDKAFCEGRSGKTCCQFCHTWA